VRHVGLALAAAAISLLATTGCGSSGDTTSGGQDAKPSRADGPRDVVDWYGQGGATLVTHLGADLSAIAADTATTPHAPALAGHCQALATDTTAATNYPPIPDGQAQGHWAKALDMLAAGARDCQGGHLDRSGPEIRDAGTEMRQATDRINQLTGAVGKA
jgi:hypothetical protein